MSYSICFIAGPTASGKSDLALSLAEDWQAEIVNADSMQVYSDLSVLTARPPEADLAKAPHHLYGHIDGATFYDAQKYADEASRLIDQKLHDGKRLIVVGGTGLYFKALLTGFAKIPDIPERVRKQVLTLADQSADALYDALCREDPAMATRLNRLDRQRVGRALEVVRATGSSLSEFQAQDHDGPLGALDRAGSILKLTLMPDRDALYDRCNRRFQIMMDGGALDEVRALAARGLDNRYPVMRALGVPQLIGLVRGDMQEEECIADIQMHTRRFAKRQLTWMRNQFNAWNRLELKYNNTKDQKIFDKVSNSLLTGKSLVST